MTNSSTTLEALSYLGLGTVVARTHPESGVDLTYIGAGPGEGGDQYVGLDRFGRVIDQRWKTTSTDKDRYLYGYDRNSNRLYRTNELDHTFDELYHADGASNGYDGLNQLSEFQRGMLSDTNSDTIPDTVSTASRSQTWDPDALGNFEGVNTDGTNQTRTHNKQNQSTVVGGNNLVFDNNGNTTTDETGRTLGWDAWNRLVKVNGSTRYAVDALGRRIKEGSTDLYYTTNWQMIEEQVSGTTTSHFVWSPVYVDALVLRERDLAKPAGVMDERLYVMQDANFNVTGLVNTSGTVVERYVQDPYGRFDVKDASWGVRASSSYAWVYLHQGGRWDATSALFSFRYRDYSPTLMRWVSVDPIGFVGGLNLYEYGGDNPTTSVDPLGLFWWIGPCTACLRPTPQPVLPRPVTPVNPLPNPGFTPRPPVALVPDTPNPNPEGPQEPRPVGPNERHYPEGYPSDKPWKCPDSNRGKGSDCTQAELDRLNKLVDQKCPGRGFVDFPTPRDIYSTWWSCWRIENLAKQWEACAKARRDVMNKCFRGGDGAHQQRAAIAEYHVSYAYYLLRYWRCPGYNYVPPSFGPDA